MTVDALSARRLAGCHPLLVARFATWQEKLANGSPPINIIVVAGFRSWSAQAALYALGRDAAGTVVDPAAVVTWAAPGHSWHEFGLALDAAPVDDGGRTLDWDVGDPAWRQIYATYTAQKFFCGKDFPGAASADKDHFQLAELPLAPDDTIRQTFLEAGIAAAWAELGLPETP